MAREVDVVIVGGGLVGLSLACALGPSRLETMMVEAQPAPAPVKDTPPERDGVRLSSGYEPRVSAINPASRDFLGRVGGWPGHRLSPFTSMSVRDGRGTASIAFDAGMIGEQALGYIVENRNVLATLAQTAGTSDGLDMRFGTSIESIEVCETGYRLVFAGGDTVACRLLVGADGGNSFVRKACGLRALKWSYGQDAVVTSIMTERTHGACARQWFTSEGTLAFLPLAPEEVNLCSIVYATDRAGDLLALDDAALCEKLTLASEGTLGRVLAVDKRYSFPLVQQHALSYVRPHLALIGDAAHVIHPLAGQGVNLGFADAHALSVALADCRLSGQAPGDISLLRRYQRARQPFNMMMATAMEGFRRLYGPDQPAVNWLRNAGMKFVDGNLPLKATIMKVACGR